MYSLLRPLIFQFSPETAHNLALTILSYANNLRLLELLPSRISCPVKVMGLEFPNPVGLGAGMDKDGECIDAWEKLGFGFIEVGTVTPRPQGGNPAPRLFRLPAAQGIINRMGFNNRGVDYLVQRLRISRFNGIIGVNIGKNRDTPVEKAIEDYLFCLDRVYSLAGYVAINVSSPNTPNLRQLQNADELSKLLTTLKLRQEQLTKKYNRYVPLVVKIAPDITEEEIVAIGETLLATGMDGVIATNTTIQRDGVINLPYGQEGGGLSGQPLFNRSTYVLQQLHKIIGHQLPIIGIGGITTPQDALIKRAAGASLIQLYSGMIYAGPELVPAVAKALCCRE